MKITIIGTGYVGLVSGSCFSEFGFEVSCFDIDNDKIKLLKAGKIPIYEPGLKEIVTRNQAEGRLTFTTNLKVALKNSQVIFLAVGTPTVTANNEKGLIEGSADLSYIEKAASNLAPMLDSNRETIIVIKSTVPIGTTRKIAKLIRNANPTAKISMVSNPEFLREGSAVNDFFRPDRVIIGLENQSAKTLMDRLYRPLYLFETPKLYTELETAETIKYAANSFLATKIAFINEMADLCEKTGANIKEVATGIGLDNRIGKKFLHPSPGFGGSCFPKDLRGLLAIAKEYNTNLSIANAVNTSNNNRIQEITKKIINLNTNASIKDTKIAILGLAFKPNTDDIRESPALKLITNLYNNGAIINAFDPIAMDNAKKYFASTQIKVKWCDNSYATIKDSNIVIIVTEWNEFRSLNLQKAASIMKENNNGRKILIDLRNIYLPEEVACHNLEYHSIGRKPKPLINKNIEIKEYV